MEKVCLILNATPHYRKGIFELIDRDFDAYFVAGKENADIQSLETSSFRHEVAWTRDIKFKGHRIWQRGILRYVFKGFDTYIISEDIFKINLWIFLLLCRLIGKRTYVWSHVWYGKETRLQRMIKKVFYRLFTGYFLYGNYARELMIKEGFKPSSLYVIHNSLDYDNQLIIRNQLKPTDVYKSHFGNNNHVIIFIGRLTKVKKLEMLIECVKQIKERGKSVNLVFVGDGKERQNLEILVLESNLEDCIWFYGACFDDKKNAELIYNADLCVAPGNVGLTAMHAMVFGCPVISHNDFKWQMPEFEAIHPGITGNFFERDNINALTETILNWFENHANDREIVRKNCFEEIDTQWNPHFQIEIIKKVINNKK